MTAGRPVIRAGDVERDRHLALGMFTRHLNPQYDDARFDWVYRQNPHGPGRLWIAMECEGGVVVGIAGAFPRRISVSGRKELAWVLGDFCVGDAHRSLGPALALQRACLADVTANGAWLCYDFPSSGMMAVYRRLGIKPLGQMVRFVRPLGIEARLRRTIGNAGVSSPLRTLARMFMAPRRGREVGASGLEVSLQSTRFGSDFTELYQRSPAQQVVIVERSAEYLNWRYLDNPVQRHEVLTAHHAGRLLGYAIFTQDAHVMTLVDMFAGGESEVIAELIQSAVALAWQRHLDAVSMSLLQSSSWIQALKHAGFREREASPVVVHASQKVWPEVGDERDWLLLYGDRDS